MNELIGLFKAAPANMITIFSLLGAVLLACIIGWRHSVYTRRLVTFAAIIIALLIIAVGLTAFVRRTWFPQLL